MAMLSRVADSIYWMNRYIERAENYARFIGVNFNLAFDLPPNVNEQWEPLLIATADNYLFYQHYDEPTRENVINFMTFDKRNPNSIYSCLLLARENGRTIRECISKEMWENLNELYLWIKDVKPQSEWDLNHMQNFYTQVRNGTQLYYGVVDATITRNEAWHFGRLGRFMERADKTSRFWMFLTLLYCPILTLRVVHWSWFCGRLCLNRLVLIICIVNSTRRLPLRISWSF